MTATKTSSLTHSPTDLYTVGHTIKNSGTSLLHLLEHFNIYKIQIPKQESSQSSHQNTKFNNFWCNSMTVCGHYVKYHEVGSDAFTVVTMNGAVVFPGT